MYRKNLKFRTPRKTAVLNLKIEQGGFPIEKCIQKIVDWMANSVDPDQTAPLEGVWSVSTLFAQICLSENLGSLW